MKKNFYIGIIIFFVFIIIMLPFLASLNFVSSVKADNSYFQVGRWQLFQGTYIFRDNEKQKPGEILRPDNTREEQRTAIFLLDTTTGKVFKYAIGITWDGKFYENWYSTEYSPNE
ncbi:MAG: hypothetical protein AB1397_07800 [bacterium]